MKTYPKYALILVFIPVLVIPVLSLAAQYAFGQEDAAEQYVNRRVEIWGLFYRLMVVAFIVGTVVNGVVVYVVWRFRESHPKNRLKESMEGAKLK